MQNGIMYARLLQLPLTSKKSVFLFGPRGTGKTMWLKNKLPHALYLDMLESDLYIDLLARPQRLDEMIPKDYADYVVIDEVQKVPQLLSEVHRLIENQRCSFILTGSSARSLKRKGVNLLAGRALTYWLHPLTSIELGHDFRLERSLIQGHLPATYSEPYPKRYLDTYIQTYLREEVLQEGLTRNLAAFTRFLETASFSQGSPINASAVGREAGIHRKVVDHYFDILEDLLIAYRLPVFTKHAKRRLSAQPKFYFFDAGVYRTIRPMGPLDSPEEAEGTALETLVFQELLAINDYFDLGYKLFYWRTSNELEVDFVLYGPRGLVACEVKRSRKVNDKDLRGLFAFERDYPEAKLFYFYGGERKEQRNSIQLIPTEQALTTLPTLL